jgi:hypothetical protein
MKERLVIAYTVDIETELQDCGDASGFADKCTEFRA